MNRIQKISSYLLLIFGVLLIAVPLLSIIQWIFISTKTSDVSGVINFFGIFEKTIQTPEGYVNLSNVSWTPMLQLLGFSADIIGLLPFLISLFVLRVIFKNYQKGEIFSVRNAILYRRLGALFLLDALLIKSLSQTLMVLAVTFTSPPGHRYLTVSFGTPHLTSLFYGILVIIVSWVMLEASKLHDEQKFTI
jgi:hypothetical protein